MQAFISICGRFLARGIGKSLFVLGVLYGFYVVYVNAHYALVPNGSRDPIYLLLDIRRSDQIVIVSISFALIVVPLLILFLARDGRPLNFVTSLAVRRGTLLLVALIFLNSVAASLAAVLNELNSQFWVPLFAWVAVVLVLQVLIVYAALKWVGQSWIPTN